jgi:hypothetical protein
MGTAMGMGTGTRFLTRQILVPVALPVTKKLDLEFKLLLEFKLTSPPYLTKQLMTNMKSKKKAPTNAKHMKEYWSRSQKNPPSNPA